MLKSTHRSAGLQPSSSLPEGWTEHTAPSGHKYYYNKSTKQSTYTRPTIEQHETTTQDEEPLFAEEAGPDPIMQATLRAQEQFSRNATQQSQPGHFTGGRSYQQRPRRGHGGDRPKKKAPIPDCAPWLLITTKFGRRFVHNTETKQSLWKFPQDVMLAVIAMDRIEWEKKQEKAKEPAPDPDTNNTNPEPIPASGPQPATEHHDYDSSEYEEVEVTDDEDTSPNTNHKRPRLSASSPPTTRPTAPAELTEDDIAWQLAALEASDEEAAYSDPNANDQLSSPDTHNNDSEADDGLAITDADNTALFRSLLDDTSTSPYAPFDSLLTLPPLVEDPRWLVLPNMSARQAAFVSWSRDRVAELQALKDAQPAPQTDARVEYLRFLEKEASTKLFWVEFKRKWRKSEVMKGYEMQDKEREKVYREFVGKLKLGMAQRRRELGELLKGTDKKGDGNRVGGGAGENGEGEVPLSVLRDVRYWVVGERERREVVSAWRG